MKKVFAVYRILLFVYVSLFVYLPSLLAENAKSTGIDIVYHICTLNNWQQVVTEQIQTLEKSGLGNICDSMTVTVVGPEFEKVPQLFDRLSFLDKVQIIQGDQSIFAYEFPGIEKVIQIANEKPHTRILYFHSKGVSHYQTSYEQPTRFWRRYMEYFNIERWEDCVKALDEFDVCGVDWTLALNGLPFFGGNFWWGRADYIRTCILERRDRFCCELFIGTGDHPKAKSFHQSGENPMLSHLTYATHPQFFHLPPSSPYHRGILVLHHFSYLDEYYRN